MKKARSPLAKEGGRANQSPHARSRKVRLRCHCLCFPDPCQFLLKIPAFRMHAGSTCGELDYKVNACALAEPAI